MSTLDHMIVNSLKIACVFFIIYLVFWVIFGE
jgi:hypothetical protein